jgi:hypothetical protein
MKNEIFKKAVPRYVENPLGRFAHINLIKIIFPTRGRYELLIKLLDSIESNTKNKDKIEVIAICDSDDFKSVTILNDYVQKSKYDLKFVVIKRKDLISLPVHYYDIGLKIGNNSLFTWILGNDCSIITEDWDDHLEQLVLKNESEICNNILNNKKYYYLIISDDTHWDKNGLKPFVKKNPDLGSSCCFPIVSTNYCRTAGEFYPLEFLGWGGDLALKKIVDSSPMFEILYLNDKISIEHTCFHNGKYQKDPISTNMESISQRFSTFESVNIDKVIEKRKKFLK